MTVLSARERAWFDRALASITAAEVGPSAGDLKHAPELNLWRPQVNVFGELVLGGSLREMDGHDRQARGCPSKNGHR